MSVPVIRPQQAVQEERLTAKMAADTHMLEYNLMESRLREALEKRDLVSAKVFKKALVSLLKQQFGI